MVFAGARLLRLGAAICRPLLSVEVETAKCARVGGCGSRSHVTALAGRAEGPCDLAVCPLVMPVPSRPCHARTALYRPTQLRVPRLLFGPKARGWGLTREQQSSGKQRSKRRGLVPAAGRTFWLSFRRKVSSASKFESLERGARAPPARRAGMRASHDRDAGMGRSSRARRGWKAEKEGERRKATRPGLSSCFPLAVMSLSVTSH